MEIFLSVSMEIGLFTLYVSTGVSLGNYIFLEKYPFFNPGAHLFAQQCKKWLLMIFFNRLCFVSYFPIGMFYFVSLCALSFSLS